MLGRNRKKTEGGGRELGEIIYNYKRPKIYRELGLIMSVYMLVKNRRNFSKD